MISKPNNSKHCGSCLTTGTANNNVIMMQCRILDHKKCQSIPSVFTAHSFNCTKSHLHPLPMTSLFLPTVLLNLLIDVFVKCAYKLFKLEVVLLSYFSVPKRAKPSRYRYASNGRKDFTNTYNRKSTLYPPMVKGLSMYD